MVTWTPESAVALAPDPASAKAAMGLANPGKWVSLGRDPLTVWGEVKGSGASPYRAAIDLREPAFRCTCPSRKFPCKHGLALAIILARGPATVPGAEPPGWVTEWLAGRDRRGQARADGAAVAKPADPKAAERRALRREALVRGGVVELRRWLGDLLRAGIAAAPSQPPSFWHAMAARLVDAQAPGLARLVRDLEGIAGSGAGWEGRLLHGIARLELIGAAWERSPDLPPALLEEARSAVGWSRTQAEVAGEPPVGGRWRVVGIAEGADERLTVRRTWLWGLDTARAALLLDFAAGAALMAAPLPVGAVLRAEVRFYPGAMGLRAALGERQGPAAMGDGRLPGVATVDEALDGYAAALGRTPWLERCPMLLSGVRISVRRAGEGTARMAAVDGQGRCLPIASGFGLGWQLVAIGGGQAVDLVGEWDGSALWPLSVADGQILYGVGGAHAVRHAQAAA